ncbi:MAG: hypothetical protein P4L10_01940 [Acidobacteriaceae bacterium]|nr:hypothetical protein [Acidobacteriaceae bacterium]
MQLKIPLLCKACEDKLNKNGERYFLAQCLQADQSFPLFSRADLARHALISMTNGGAYWKAADLGIDYPKISYFAASLFWRTFVAKHKIPKERISLELDAHVAEALRAFLNEETHEIPGVMIKVDLINRIPHHEFRSTFALPQEVPSPNFGSGVRFYTCEALGFAFTMTSATDPQMVSAMYTNCLIHNPDHPLFVSEQMTRAAAARQVAWVQRSTPTEHLSAYNKAHGI